MLTSLFIVDDDPITVKICEMVIKNTEFASAVTHFENGQKCINFFSNYFEKNLDKSKNVVMPELILLDLNMPVLDGWGFLDHYERKYANRLTETKIAILTSSINPQDFMKAQQYSNIIDFIYKPLLTNIVEELKEHEALKMYFS
ncbi:MAG TPA: response regulator [Chitinophagaceae bacterium]|nr:response regulator [Chitinophagaceae bacterium]MCC6634640.1 response regulator [Chitinophagaceae bacterium]HMZ47032.1 response regulator [Chitinophagaceae bacterium]HNE93591.1 response regulator [Chitinophagaceae bacterium]HNF29917.1 response regulator [Chitinophagaceae bacterium]